MNIKIVVVLDLTRCNFMEVHRRFGDDSTRLRGVMSQKTAPREPHICVTLQCILRVCGLGFCWLTSRLPFSSTSHDYTFKFLALVRTIATAVRTSELAATLYHLIQVRDILCTYISEAK